MFKLRIPICFTLFFDIATQALGGFGSENDSFFGMKKGLEGP